MKYPKYVENVINEIVSALRENRMQSWHWSDLARLKKFNFEKDAPPVYGMTFNHVTEKWEKIQITPPFLSTWAVAKGFPRKHDENATPVIRIV